MEVDTTSEKTTVASTEQFVFNADTFYDNWLAAGQLTNISLIIGWLIRSVAIVILVVLFWLSISQAPRWAEFALPAGVAISLYIYSAYLLRNREIYSADKSLKNLSELEPEDLGNAQIDLSSHISSNLGKLLLAARPVAGGNIDSKVFLIELLKSPASIELLGLINLDKEKQSLVLTKLETLDLTNYGDNFLENLFTKAALPAISNNHLELEIADVVVALLTGGFIDQLLFSLGVQRENIEALQEWLQQENYLNDLVQTAQKNAGFYSSNGVNDSFTSIKAPSLEKYAVDLTFAAKQELLKISASKGTLKPTISMRRDTTTAILGGLAAKTGLVFLIGGSGSGKSVLVNTLAWKFLALDVPGALKDWRLLRLNVSALLESLTSPAQLATRLETLLSEQERSGNIVLVIEEFDQLLRVRDDLQQELLSIFNGVLRKYQVKILATATDFNYDKYMRNLPELTGLFQNITLQSATTAQTLSVLFSARRDSSLTKGVNVESTALYKILTNSEKLNSNLALPDRAIDFLEEVITAAVGEGLQVVSANFVDGYLKNKLGITSTENNSAVDYYSLLTAQIVGQEQAVKLVANALTRARAGLAHSVRPSATLLFAGPTGVGKTFLAQLIAKTFFGNEKLFLRLDMSEYQEEKNLDSLLGSYKSETEFTEGLLTGFAKKQPFGVILLDEIEKANPKVLDLFLQLFDNGVMRDGTGQPISFRNEIIVATTNVGAREMLAVKDEGATAHDLQTTAKVKLQEFFRLEFLNRFDEIIVFNKLSMLEAEKIIWQLVAEEKLKLAGKGIELQVTQSFVTSLLKSGFNNEFGARELRRLVQRNLEDYVAAKIVDGSVKAGGTIIVDNHETN